MNPSTEKKKRPMLRRLALPVALVVLIAGVVAAALAMRGDDPQQRAPVFTVATGPLTITVSESGAIEAREQIVIKSEVEGSATILYLVPEGTLVSEGDMLVELDAAQLQDNQVEQQIRLQNAEAAFIRSRENLAVVKNQAEADMAKADLDLQFARQDLRKYLEGEYPNSVKEAESRIRLSEAELKRAVEKLDWSTVLNKEKYISKTELEADQLAMRKAELDLQLSQSDLDLLKEFTHPRRMAELKSGESQAAMALERIKRKAAADVVQAEADLAAKQAELKQQEGKLAKNKLQIERTRIRAPRAGMVVYATSTQASWRGNANPLEEGQQVRERQELIYLPTADLMTAKISVHESDLDKIRVGMPTRITVDALPGQVFTGTVARIAPLPDASSMFMNPDLKIYDTEVHVTGATTGLRTGMSCRVDIIAARYPDATFVPVQAVVRHGTQPVVYVRQATGFEPRPIEIGLDNNRMIHVREGLAQGDIVLLTPPLASGAVEHEVDDDAGETNAEIPAAATDTEALVEPVAAADAAVEPVAVEASASAPDRDRARGDAGAAAPADGGDAGRDAMRRRFENMTPEEREQMLQRIENMTPEQREQMRQMRGRRRSGDAQQQDRGPAGEARPQQEGQR